MSDIAIIRPRQLAAEWQVDPATIYRWVVAGHLPPLREFGPRVSGWLLSEIAAAAQSRPISTIPCPVRPQRKNKIKAAPDVMPAA
jgi:predicted DNA-binding transcriptional regulator AlpA